MRLASRPAVVAALGSAQTLAWASSYYLPAVLATPMARDLGIESPTVFAAFSMALAVSALVGPAAGRAIDRRGGRPVLIGTNVLFAIGLLALAFAGSATMLFFAWALLGLAMGAGLYEGGFATLVRLYGSTSRNPITGITLIAGFASTVGWPLSAWLESQFGWRGACLAWAALHVALGLPLNALLPTPRDVARDATPHGDPPAALSPPSDGTIAASAPAPSGAGATPAGLWIAALLATVFTISMFIATAMAAHLPRVLQDSGASLAAAVAVGALIGPSQVAARLVEFGLLRRLHPLVSARAATLGHPLGALALLLLGPAFAPLFAILHGAGNGMMTIAKGTLPLVFFGAHGYGARQGWLMLPARVAQAIAPFAFGLALDRFGAATLWLTAALGALSFAALLALHARRSVSAPAGRGSE